METYIRVNIREAGFDKDEFLEFIVGVFPRIMDDPFSFTFAELRA